MSSATVVKTESDILLPPPGLAAYFREQELKRIPVTTVQIHAYVNNTCAFLRCVIRYQELESDSSESIFTFPLDESSAISSFKAEVGNKKIIAKIQERTLARETYERALENKQSTILLEQDSRSDDVFTMRIGGIPKGESALIRLDYIRKLDVFSAHNESVAQWDWPTVYSQGLYPPRGSLSLILPTVLNPRYSPKGSDIVPNTTTNAIVLNTIPYDFQFSAKIEGSMKIKRVFSPTDYYETEYLKDDNTAAKVSLRITGEYEKRAYNHDLQMLIEYEEPFAAHAFYEIVSQHSEDKSTEANLFANTDVVMVNFMPNFYPANAPELVYEETLLDEKNEFVFLVDQSGSMTGIRNEQAKEALMLFLKSLPVGSFFQVIGYGTDFKSLFPQGAQEYNERNLRTAMRYKDDLEAAMGGTEILPALNHIFSQQVRNGYKRQIFLITDGEVSNTNEVIELVYRYRDQTTVFTVGIGEGASTALVKGVARAGGGRAEFIHDDDKNFSGRIISLLRSATQPTFESASVSIDLPKGVSYTMVPRVLPNVYQNRYTNIFIYLSGDFKSLDKETLKGSATLKGSILNREISSTVTFERPVNKKVEVGFEMPLHLLGARTRIQDFTDSLSVSGYSNGAFFDTRLTENERTKRIAEIVSISRVFNILSRYTAFVGVDEASNVVDGLNLKEVPSDNAATSSGFDQRNDSYDDDDDTYSRYPFSSGFGGSGGGSSRHRNRRDPFSGRSAGGHGRDPRDRDNRPRPPPQKAVTNLGSQQTQPSPYDSLPHFMREMMGLVSENSDVISTAVPPPPVLERTPVIRLAELVRVNGSWEAQHDVYRAINAKRDIVLNNKPEDWSKDEWITLIVVIFLKKKCTDKEEQWSMLVSKAYYWLSAFGRKTPLQITEKTCKIYELMEKLFNPTS